MPKRIYHKNNKAGTLMFWNGEYHFFDYKYNIAGYSGQDYDGGARWFYMIFTLVSIAALLVIFRNAKRKNVERYMKVAGILLPILEIAKVTWESVWDVRTGRGFNWEGLLPIYTCSLFIYCMIFAAFTKGKVHDWCLSWVATIGLVGGLSNVLFIRGLNWYPFFTFGAFYSMTFHYLMVFTALFIVVTRYKEFRFSDIWKAFAVHGIFSLLVIPTDFYHGWDYMQYYEAGGVPLFEDLSDKLAEAGLRFLTAPMMLLVYLALDALLVTVFIGCQTAAKKLKERKKAK